MTARERTPEYATLKALGFGPAYVARLVFGESLAIALGGAALGIALTFPVAAWFGAELGQFFPVFEVSGRTVALQAACALAVGVVAALLPGRTAARVRIVDGLRAIG
jgi:putative ABC transport system permease protein